MPKGYPDFYLRPFDFDELLGNHSMMNLAKRLKNSNVMHLDLSYLVFEPRCVNYLAEILRETQITYLNFCNSNLGPLGAMYLADGLRHSQVTNLHLHGNCLGHEGYQYLVNVVDDTNVTWVNLHRNNLKRPIEESFSIPRNTVPVAERIRHAVSSNLVAFNSENELEFNVPKNNYFLKSGLEQYTFLIKTLITNPKVKVHILETMYGGSCCFNLKKVTDFVNVICEKFNTFINDKVLAVVEVFGEDANYVNLVKEFEEMKCHDIVKNLLLHRQLYLIDEGQEILHPYIYMMLKKYDMVLYSEQIEPHRKDAILSYFRSHPEVSSSQDVIDLLS